MIVASGSHRDAKREALDDLAGRQQPADANTYAASKLCTMLVARELARRRAGCIQGRAAAEQGWSVPAIEMLVAGSLLAGEACIVCTVLQPSGAGTCLPGLHMLAERELAQG